MCAGGGVGGGQAGRAAEEGVPTQLCFRERTEAQLPKAAQLANRGARAPTSASTTAEPISSHPRCYTPMAGGLVEGWDVTDCTRNQLCMGHGVQGLALLPGRTCYAILGKSQTLSELPRPQWQHFNCGEAPRELPLVHGKEPVALSSTTQGHSGVLFPACLPAAATEAGACSLTQPTSCVG